MADWLDEQRGNGRLLSASFESKRSEKETFLSERKKRQKKKYERLAERA